MRPNRSFSRRLPPADPQLASYGCASRLANRTCHEAIGCALVHTKHCQGRSPAGREPRIVLGSLSEQITTSGVLTGTNGTGSKHASTCKRGRNSSTRPDRWDVAPTEEPEPSTA
jgi:hypothetical protein